MICLGWGPSTTPTAFAVDGGYGESNVNSPGRFRQAVGSEHSTVVVGTAGGAVVCCVVNPAGYLCRCSIPIDGSSVTRRSSLPGSERTETLSKVIRVA